MILASLENFWTSWSQMLPLKVYYLDDEEDLLPLFQDTFSSPEILIKTFSNVQDFIEAVKKNTPDLVFLDYRLPNTTGLDIATQLSTEIPKALVTGEINLKDTPALKAIFAKPYPIDKIEAFINSFLIAKKESI